MALSTRDNIELHMPEQLSTEIGSHLLQMALGAEMGTRGLGAGGGMELLKPRENDGF